MASVNLWLIELLLSSTEWRISRVTDLGGRDLTVTADTQQDAGPGSFGLRYGAVLGVLAAASLTLAALPMSRDLQLAALSAAGAFAVLAVGGLALSVGRYLGYRRRLAVMVQLVETDPALGFVCAQDGRVLHANRAARDRFHPQNGVPLADVLRDVFASAEGVLYRIENRALPGVSVTEDISSHSERFRVHLQRFGEQLSLWRFEPDAAMAAQVQAQAMVTLGRNNSVLYMNEAARALIGSRIKRLDDVIEDMPLRPGSVHLLRTADDLRRVHLQVQDSATGRREVTLAVISDEDAATSGDKSGFDSLPVPLIRVAPDGGVLQANPEARRLLDMPQGRMGNLGEYMEGLGRALTDWLAEAAEGKGLHRSEFLRLTRADREIFVQVTLAPTRDEGEPALIAVLNDATELKTLEAQFVQSQKMQAIGQLAGGVAHDFNNLLTAISGHCDLLLLRHDQGDPDYGDLVQINQNANRAAALVGQLLAFSRKQTMRPEMLDLRDTLADLTHLLNRLVGEKVQLTLRHDPLLPHIRADRRQLEQVMMNLVVNARDAMQEGGEVIIETERRVLTEPLKRDRAIVAPGTYVTVTVTDEGIGIPPDKLQKVFEPFFTTKRTGEGTGLGLSTVYGIVKQSGGFIFVDSVVAKGTVFTLMFPAHDVRPELAQPAEAPEASTLPQQGSGVVLLVEDEAPVRAFAARALRLRGYTVIEAETAEEALDMLEDSAVKVDVFVTDVVMPGMDGPSWVREALKVRPDTRVVFVSGYAEDIFGPGHEAVPNSVFLPKPFSLSDLTDTVNRQVAAGS